MNTSSAASGVRRRLRRGAALALCGCVAALLAWVGVAAPVGAQPQSVRPGVNAAYADADFRYWQGVFERPGREVYDRRHDIVAASGLRPGMSVADIGAGTGLFTLLFARAVGPDGRVYAVDLVPSFVAGTLARARAEGLANVDGVVNTERDVALPPASIDLAFICEAYHHFEYPDDTLASMRRALRPGGILVLVDFMREPGSSSAWVMGHVRAGRERVIAEVEAAGFRLVADEGLLRDNYFLRFRRE